ncbi:hypothetical protein FBZ93_111130 [Bradyrhizobium macuxiense]|uniref:Uncharacterized protein n=1 Tax=Bradyrhizobium macuxiense TaxID=1755647 RepID=A0A560LBY6_9BRAD|nr:hypothetical protein FBZ93_111130 [Bradyrhizobium macuxiense]
MVSAFCHLASTGSRARQHWIVQRAPPPAAQTSRQLRGRERTRVSQQLGSQGVSSLRILPDLRGAGWAKASGLLGGVDRIAVPLPGSAGHLRWTVQCDATYVSSPFLSGKPITTFRPCGSWSQCGKSGVLSYLAMGRESGSGVSLTSRDRGLETESDHTRSVNAADSRARQVRDRDTALDWDPSRPDSEGRSIAQEPSGLSRRSNQLLRFR